MDNAELTAKLLEIDERVTRHTEQIKTCFSEIREVKVLADSVQRLSISTEILARDTKAIGGKVDEIAGEIKEIKEKPARQWDSTVRAVITGVITAIVGYCMGKMGLV